MPKVGVILSGCGVMDGSEIHESVLTLLALGHHNAEVVCMAPDVDQAHVINHLTGKEMKEKRNVLVESARIARGKIKNIKDVKADDLDALIMPGGYGAAKNLCTFAFDGETCQVNPEVGRLVREIHKAGKPIGAICISPVLIAKVLEGDSIQMTIGKDQEVGSKIQQLGQKHQACGVEETCVDRGKKIVTTPAYMLANNLNEASKGINKLVGEVLALIGEPAKK